MRVDLLVVGASFAGLACARAAALAGLRVLVIDRKASAGEKLHTTGIVVKDAVDQLPWLADVPQALVRRTEGVRLYAPDMRHLDLRAPGYYFWATDTPALLDWMVDGAAACGATVRMNTLFENALRVGAYWQVPLNDGVVQARYLVGADGPHSRVAKVLGLSRNTQFLYGVEHEYAHAGFEPGLLHCFVDRRLARGYIGWALQGTSMAQVGVAQRVSSDGAPLRVDGLIGKAGAVLQLDAAEPVAVRAGMIPCGGVLARTAREGAMLVGDAAGMVSPVTAGGIHLALQHGESAGAAVAQFLRRRAADPADWLPRTYPRLHAKRALRWAFDRFQSDWIFNRLLSTHAMRRVATQIYFHRKAQAPLAPGGIGERLPKG